MAIQHVMEFKRWFTRNIIGEFNNYQLLHKLDNNKFKMQINIICRMDYLAHPRNKNKMTSRMFEDDELIENIVRKAVSKQALNMNIKIERIYLEKMTMKEQLMKMMETNVLIGVHGAGLTYALFLPPNATVIELMVPSRQGNNHFLHLSKWSDHRYERIKCKENRNGYVQINTQQLSNVIMKIIEHK